MGDEEKCGPKCALNNLQQVENLRLRGNVKRRNALVADEDLGFNVGERTYENGNCLYENIPTGGSKEAYELGAEIQGFDLRDFGLTLTKDGSTYDYVEELSLIHI